MKRGRVKRVYYQVTQEVQQEDGRAEFLEQESQYKQLERSQQAKEHESANAWMEKQQLLQIRQMQDEQFRMMELMINTQQQKQQ